MAADKMPFVDFEVETCYEFILREQFPLYASFILHDLKWLVLSGIGAALPVCLFIFIPVLRAVYGQLKSLTSLRTKRRGVFCYYQAAQSTLFYLAMCYPDLAHLYVLTSTVILVDMELSLCEGLVANALVIGKCLLMWCVYTYFSGRFQGNYFELMMSVAWALLHLWQHTATRTAVRHKMRTNMQELEEEKERVQALLQAIPDGAIAITEDRKVVAHNRIITQMLQLDATADVEEQLFATLGLLFYAPNYKKTVTEHKVLLEDVLEHISTVKQNTSIDFGSVLYLGHYLEWRGTTSVWNQTKACILVVREVGEWVQLEALAKKESEAKSALIRSVSHELRTPINAIINISRQLLEKSSNQEDKENLQILVSSSNFLLSNVNDLLDFSRISCQQFQINKQPFRLQEAIHTCIEIIAPQCRLKGLYLSARYDSSIPQVIFNDSDRLKQVLLNLLSNAVKFTLRGKIELIAVFTEPTIVKITVQDTGIGITKANQKKIFTLFGKLTGNEKLNPQGCGLGLAISNTLVMCMGGKGIRVESLPGKGSKFSFHLPIYETQGISGDMDLFHSDHYEFEEQVDGIELPKSTELWKDPRARTDTLIADDSDFNRVVLKKLLEQIGFRCDETSTGAEALRAIVNRERDGYPYLYIFLDIEMPEMTGIEVAREVRRLVSEGEMTKAKIVGCSAYVGSEDRLSCLDAGMDYFLAKPVSKETLLALCSHLRYT